MSLHRLTSLSSSLKSPNWTRLFATSAQKRKWKRQAMKKKSTKQIPEAEVTEAVTPREEKNGFLRPFLFLGVMPLLMSSLVIWSRGDLLQDVKKFEPIRKEFQQAAQEQQKIGKMKGDIQGNQQ